MVAYRRNFVAGGTFFFTLTLWDRSSCVLTENIDLVRRALRVTRRARPFAINAIVVLPEHLHAVLTLPAADADYSGRWRRFKGLFSRLLMTGGANFVKNHRGEYAIWQRRFWEHTIRDESDLERHVDYIHFNPVKHGYVLRACDWPYSSFHRFVKLRWLPLDWGGAQVVANGKYGERIP